MNLQEFREHVLAERKAQAEANAKKIAEVVKSTKPR